MNSFIKILSAILISFIIGYLLSYYTKEEPIIETVSIPGDSIFTVKVDTFLVPTIEYKTYYDSIFLTDTVLMPVDTQAILRDYYTARVYVDTIQDDSSMIVIIKDSLIRNRLITRRSFLKNNRVTTINNIYSYKQNGLYIGTSISKNFIQFNTSYLYKNSNFELGINFINLKDHSKIVPSIGYKYLIKRKK